MPGPAPVPGPVRLGRAVLTRADRARLAGRGAADLRHLRRHLPSFPTSAAIDRAATDLRPAYEAYVTEVSSPGMAMSPETAAVLLALCRALRIASAMDLGSGFSSYVLRVWAAESGCEVVSADDDAGWLNRTRHFLAVQHVDGGELRIWPDIPDRRFELVFHDLANGATREAAMPRAVQASSKVVLFDDAHHAGHRAAMTAACAQAQIPLYSLRSVTVDWIRRFAMLAVR